MFRGDVSKTVFEQMDPSEDADEEVFSMQEVMELAVRTPIRFFLLSGLMLTP